MSPFILSELNTALPCYGYDKERLILSTSQLEKLNFSLEKEEPVVTCTTYPWRKSGSEHRYTRLGFSSTLSELQEANGVNDRLRSVLPFQMQEQYFDLRDTIKLQPLLRRRPYWDIDCDKDERTSRTSFYQALQQISPYFYTQEELKALKKVEQKLPDLEFHESYHSGEYHLTVTLSTFAAFTYNLFVLLFFMKKTLCMSERNPMHRDYRAHILKSGNQFCLLYMLSALLICFCLVVIVYNCHRIV